jgi:secreted PhoX family phosphatase
MTDIEVLVEKAMSRRQVLGSGAVFGLTAFVLGSTSLSKPAMAASRLAFDAVAANSLDTVTVPKGYNWHVVAKWGQPLWSHGADFDPVTRGTGASQAKAVGDNTDGMALFSHRGKSILAINNEFANHRIMFGNRKNSIPANADDVMKGKMAHGVSVVEVEQSDETWAIVKDSPYNRRITPDTEMAISGPARGHALMKTAADPSGSKSLGTWNNCGNGRTPWGTYLTCEENFNGYFSSSDPGYISNPEHTRYGIGNNGRGYGWAAVDERFDISKHPNEANRAGYVVEIDPLDPTSIPKKRTALGRFKHENAELMVAGNGQVVVYMGDDERGEFLYKFISDKKYTVDGDNTDVLESGQLFAAKFHDGGNGEWLALTPESTGLKDQAEICIHTRQAASAVGATTMDRPEWVAANPKKAEVYCALTNNKYRGLIPNNGGDETPVGGPNPRKANKYGQIVRWLPEAGDHINTAFNWDLFVLAGNPRAHNDARKGSANVTVDNMFNSPDGLFFDRRGLLWIQTDGNTSDRGDFTRMGNNQMLVGDPLSGEIRRFLVGPKGCEITGSAWSPDRRTLFIGIQHPTAHFPDGGYSVPRSSVIAIRRDDAGIIG